MFPDVFNFQIMSSNKMFSCGHFYDEDRLEYIIQTDTYINLTGAASIDVKIMIIMITNTLLAELNWCLTQKEIKVRPEKLSQTSV